MTRKQLEALMAWVNAKFEDAKFDDLQTGIQLIEAEERLLSLFNEKEEDEE